MANLHHDVRNSKTGPKCDRFSPAGGGWLLRYDQGNEDTVVTLNCTEAAHYSSDSLLNRMMLGLVSTHQVEREEFSQPFVAYWPPADPLEHVEIRCFVNCDHAWSVVKQGDVPAD